VTSSLAEFEATIRAKTTHLIKSCSRTRKKDNRNFYINLHLRDRLDIEFTACKGGLMPEKALTSFTVFDAYR